MRLAFYYIFAGTCPSLYSLRPQNGLMPAKKLKCKSEDV